MKLKLIFPFHVNKKIMLYPYVFDKNNGCILSFQNIILPDNIIIPPRCFIIKKHALKQFKESIKKLLSKIAFQVSKKIMLYPYVFDKNNGCILYFENITQSRGIIITKTSVASKNAIYGYNFPFKVPFHPGHGSDINEPYVPEDLGDDTDD